MKLPKSRKKAIKKGLTRYFTGKPCKYGHVSERTASSGNCVECLKTIHQEKLKAYRRTPRANKIAARWHREVNRKSMETAENRWQRLTENDIWWALLKNDDGYVLTTREVASLLGRTYRSIEHVRSKFK